MRVERSDEFMHALAIVEAETDRCWDWVYSVMPCPAQSLAIQILSSRTYTTMTAEELWALVSVATEDSELPHPSDLS